MRSVLSDEALCVIGNETKIKEERGLFQTILNLTSRSGEEDDSEAAE